MFHIVLCCVVLQVAPVMEWFSSVASAEAVKNVRFDPLSNDTMVGIPTRACM